MSTETLLITIGLVFLALLGAPLFAIIGAVAMLALRVKASIPRR